MKKYNIQFLHVDLKKSQSILESLRTKNFNTSFSVSYSADNQSLKFLVVSELEPTEFVNFISSELEQNPAEFYEIIKENMPRLWNSIKLGAERQAEVSAFMQLYDKNNVGQVLDKMLEHSIAEQEAKLQIAEKDAIIKETQDNLDFVASQLKAAAEGAIVDPLILPEILSLAGIKY